MRDIRSVLRLTRGALEVQITPSRHAFSSIVSEGCSSIRSRLAPVSGSQKAPARQTRRTWSDWIFPTQIRAACAQGFALPYTGCHRGLDQKAISRLALLKRFCHLSSHQHIAVIRLTSLVTDESFSTYWARLKLAQRCFAATSVASRTLSCLAARNCFAVKRRIGDRDATRARHSRPA